MNHLGIPPNRLRPTTGRLQSILVGLILGFLGYIAINVVIALVKSPAKPVQKQQEKSAQKKTPKSSPAIQETTEFKYFDLKLVQTDKSLDVQFYLIKENSTEKEYIMIVTSQGSTLIPKVKFKD